MRLEPLNAASHGDDLFEIATVPDAADRFRYLSEEPPESRAAFQTWLEKVQASEDPLYFTVIDKASGKAAGRGRLNSFQASTRFAWSRTNSRLKSSLEIWPRERPNCPFP